LRKIATVHPIVAFPGFYSPMVDVHPFRDPRSSLPSWPQIIPLGWAIRSPGMNLKLKRLGLSDELLLAFARGSVHLGISSRIELDMATTFLKEHYQIDITLNLVRTMQIGWLEVWSVKTDRLNRFDGSSSEGKGLK
jgi:hypothetical protein